jgi:hypothetical protein
MDNKVRTEELPDFSGRRTKDGIVLRRPSVDVLGWVALVLLLFLWFLMVSAFMAEQNYASVADGTAGMFICIAGIRRFSSCRIIAWREGLSIVNPIRTRDVLYESVSSVGGSGSSGMTIRITGGSEIHPLAFSGSFIDHFVRSVEKNVERVNSLMPNKKKAKRAGIGIRLTRCASADVATVIATVSLFVGLALRALSFE